MSALANYLEAALLGLIFNKDAFTGPSTYLALFTSDPTDAGTGTEVSGGSYARVLIYDNASGTPDWTVAVVDGIGYKVANDDDVTFPTATAAWGTITHFGVLDAATAGNLLMHGALDESKVIGNNDVFKVSAGNLVLRLE
jgi:hypothetical protein